MIVQPRRAAAAGVSYRAMVATDMHFVEALYLSTREEEVAATGWPPDLQRTFLQGQFRAQHDSLHQTYDRADWLIIERGGEAIGRLYVNQTPKRLHIIDIALLPVARGIGLGTAILTDLIEHAACTERDVSIYIENNNPALRLYDRLGFEWREDHGLYQFMVCTPDSVS